MESGTENPHVENTVITPVNMQPEGSDLNGSFFMSEGFVWKGLFLSDALILVMCKNNYSSSVTVNYMSACVAKIFISVSRRPF